MAVLAIDALVGGLGWTYDSVAVEVRLQLALAPRVKGRGLGGVGSLGQIAGDGGVRRAANRRGRSIGRLSGGEKVVTGSARLLAGLLGGGVSRRSKVVLQVVVRPIVKGPGGPARSGLVGVLADKSTESILLGVVRNGDTASLKVSLHARVGPGVDSLVESLLRGNGSLVGGLGSRVTGLASGGTVGRSTGLGSSRGAVEDLGAVLANKSTELVGLGALGHVDAVSVAELLELSLTPGVDELVGEGSVGLLGASGGTGLLLHGLEVGEARVAADRGDQLITSGGLRSGNAVGVEPLLEVRLGPGVVKPVAGVVGSLADLLGNGIVVLANLGEQSVTLAGLRNCTGLEWGLYVGEHEEAYLGCRGGRRRP